MKENLAEILDIDDPIDRAISALLYVMKAQIFLDGNKRTAVLFANHILISHGEGLIVIPADKVAEYKELLVNYYEDKPQGEEQIRDFLISQALLRL